MFYYSLAFLLVIVKSCETTTANIGDQSATSVYDKVLNTLEDPLLVDIAKALSVNIDAVPNSSIHNNRSIKDLVYNIIPNYNISLNNEDVNLDIEAILTEYKGMVKNREIVPDESIQNSRSIVDLIYTIIPDANIKLNNDDVDLDIEALLTKYKRIVERHEVTTDDGYILKMFRIPSNNTPCFLMHGLISCADDFVTAGPKSGLAYVLSDKGCDVWLGNARGTKHSQKHKYLEPSSPNFWDFSWHEIGVFDLPAMIDYILNKTGQTSLKYVGHSQGTTVFYVLNSERPEYNKKISQMISLAPIAYLSNTKSRLVKLASGFHSVLYSLEKALGIYEVFPHDPATNALKKHVCAGLSELLQVVCYRMQFLLGGFDLQQLDVANLPVVMSHFPSSSSLKQFDHYIQEVTSGKFAKYDYGASKNMALYGIEIPPEYRLDQVITPVYLFYSEGDYLAQPADVDILSKGLGNVAETYKIPYKHFNHVDFLFGKDVKSIVYDKILDIFQL